MVAYSDLVGWALPAFIMQCIAFYYVIRIRQYFSMNAQVLRYFRVKISWLMSIINGIAVVSTFMIVLLLATAAGRPGQQPVEIWGLIFGFVLPTLSALAHMTLYHALSVGLFSGRGSDTARDKVRDAKRDAERDAAAADDAINDENQ